MHVLNKAFLSYSGSRWFDVSSGVTVLMLSSIDGQNLPMLVFDSSMNQKSGKELRPCSDLGRPVGQDSH